MYYVYATNDAPPEAHQLVVNTRFSKAIIKSPQYSCK